MTYANSSSETEKDINQSWVQRFSEYEEGCNDWRYMNSKSRGLNATRFSEV